MRRWRRRGPVDVAADPCRDRAALEALVHRTWERTLGARVARDEDFFEIGGSSLLAIMVLTQIEDELDRRVDVSIVLEKPTVVGMTDWLNAQGIGVA